MSQLSLNSTHEEMLAWAKESLGTYFDDFSTQLAQGGGGRADGEVLLSIQNKKVRDVPNAKF